MKGVIRATKTTASKVTEPSKLNATLKAILSHEPPTPLSVTIIAHKPEPDRLVCVTVISHKPKTYRVCVQVEDSPDDRFAERKAIWAAVPNKKKHVAKRCRAIAQATVTANDSKNPLSLEKK